MARLPIRKFRIFSQISEKILWSFLCKNGIEADNSAELEGFMEEIVAPCRIETIIAYGEQRFELLTNSNSWPFAIA